MSTDKPHLIRIDNQEMRVLDRKLVLGRHPGCSYVISLNDKEIGISGRHAAVDVTGDIAWIEDLGSTNGTYVRGKRINGRTQLASGERFELDRLQFEFRAGKSKAAQPTPNVPDITAALGLEELALPPPDPVSPSARLAKPVFASPPPKPEPVAAPPPPPPPPPPKPEPVVAPPPPPLPKPEPVFAPPPPPPPPIVAAPPPAEPMPSAITAIKPIAQPRAAEPLVVPKTVEVRSLETPAPPPAPRPPEPVAAPPAPPPPPPPKREPPSAEAPKPRAPEAPAAAPAAAPDSKPARKAGSWIDAPAADKTSLLLPEQRAQAQQLMGSGLYAVAETVAVPTLVFTVPQSRRVTLAQREGTTQEWTIGSNADVDVSIPQQGMSGLHAKILRNGQTWTISDLMSANGTFVNGEKINRSLLAYGDQLGFGPVMCTFLVPEGSMAQAGTTPAASKPAAAGTRVALPMPLLVGVGVLAVALLGAVIYLLVR